LLAFAGGWVDAVGYLVLVQIFTGHMSGNSIALMVRLGEGSWGEAFHRGFPIPIFVLGVALGSALDQTVVRRRVRSVFAFALTLEAVLLLLFWTLGSPLLRDNPIATDPAWRFYLVTAVPVLAMGVQNATLHRVGRQSIRTTYVSGVLTDMADGVVQRLFFRWLGPPPQVASDDHLPPQPQYDPMLLACLWLAYVGGGILGALTELHWHLRCLAVPIGCLLVIVVYDLFHPFAAPPAQSNHRTGP
jgi:uncharacterized membrane protein YoaK (UPF0700 family)